MRLRKTFDAGIRNRNNLVHSKDDLIVLVLTGTKIFAHFACFVLACPVEWANGGYSDG